MNKTTLDAVIEFKGEWPYVDCYVCVPAEDNDVAESGEFQSAKSKYTNEMWVNVCSERQFNTLVDELASNFGRHPYTYAECKKSWELTDRHEKKTIDWKFAPTNCVGHSISSCMRGYWILDNEMMIAAPDFGLKEVKFTPKPDSFVKNPSALAKMESVHKPIFTQAMCDNGVSATIGMEVKHQAVVKTVTGNSDVNNHVTLLSVNNIYSIAHTNTLEPLTPPIELIDGKAYQFEHKDKGVLDGTYDDNGKVFWSKSRPCHLGYCTNIKPLTVEGES